MARFPYIVLLVIVLLVGCAPVTYNSTSSSIIHTVREGEDIVSIAQKYKLNPEDILAANNLLTTELYPGQQLKLPYQLAKIDNQSKLVWPCEHRPATSTRKFGGVHEGFDIDGDTGDCIFAVADGVVEFSGERGNYGKVIYLNHDDNWQTRYGHNSKNLVSAGEHVKAGQCIAKIGATGNAKGPHLHFEIRHNKIPYNPEDYLLTPP
jgi:murein DD-endopeptidase MepM/ murein hydrolase activator NlpD